MDQPILLGIFTASGFISHTMVPVAAHFSGGCPQGRVNRTTYCQRATSERTFRHGLARPSSYVCGADGPPHGCLPESPRLVWVNHRSSGFGG